MNTTKNPKEYLLLTIECERKLENKIKYLGEIWLTKSISQTIRASLNLYFIIFESKSNNKKIGTIKNVEKIEKEIVTGVSNCSYKNYSEFLNEITENNTKNKIKTTIKIKKDQMKSIKEISEATGQSYSVIIADSISVLEWILEESFKGEKIGVGDSEQIKKELKTLIIN